MKYVSMMKVSLLWGLGFLATIKAYGFIGHIVAAALTWDLLAPETRERINVKTKKEFVRLACRPDQIKHRKGLQWAMPLHYYNTDDLPPHFCQTTFPRFQNEGKNLVNAARNYTLRLSSSHSVDMQDLSFFLHFMMDLHQPLHCTKYSFNVLPHHSFTVSSRLFGGNRIKVLFAGRRVSLHSLWDTHLLAHILRFSGAHPSLRRKRLLKMFRQRVVRFLKTSPRRITCDHWQTPQDLEACINNWAADTNAANCKAVWGDAVFEAGSDLASSSKYYYHARQTLLNLIVLGAMRTALLLQSCCE